MLEFFTIRRYMHPIFEKFTPYSGMVESGYMADVVGVKTKVSYFSSNHIESHVENCKYPEFNEEFFEWADVFESVFLAKDSYVMAELGAGWGRWLSRAYFACKQMYADMPCHVIGVEAEPTHFQWLKEHCAFNNIPATLIEAAVDDAPGEVGFYTGKPTEWYGQCIGGETKVKSIDLKCILNSHDRFDLIDMDVQNFEFKILNAAKDLIHKVKRFHIGTHSKEVEEQLRELFKDWLCVNDYSLFTKHKTIYGESDFNDGVQTWINPEWQKEYVDYTYSVFGADRNRFVL